MKSRVSAAPAKLHKRYLGPLGSELDLLSWQRNSAEAFLTLNLHVPLNWTQTTNQRPLLMSPICVPSTLLLLPVPLFLLCCYFEGTFFAEVLRRQAGKQAHQQRGRGAVSLMSSKAVNTRIARRRCICSHVYQAEIHRATKPNVLHVLPNATEFNKDSELQRVKDKARQSQIPEAKERPESYIMCRVRTLYPAVSGWICCSSKP